MHDKERDLIRAFVAGRMDRRELLRGAGRLGLGAAAAGYLLNQAQTEALAADFDWQANKGKTVNLLLNKHPYADAMIANLDAFKQLTGMDVKYDVFPEDVYFDKVNAALSSGSDQYDAFMTGAYQTWGYGPAGWIADLNEFISDPAKTNPGYNWDDVLPNLRASTSWSGEPFAALGGDGAKQWAVPWGFELNSIAYNKRIFDDLGITLAKNLPELVDQAKMINDAGKGVYGIGVRGSRSWATIHPGYLSAFANYGASDFTVEGGKGRASMNSKAGKEMTALWVKMIQEAGPKNWATYTWYQVGTDLGAGASAMIYDADILGYFMDGGDNKEKGNLAFSAFTPNPGATAPTPNVWIWSLAMANSSKQKDAAWAFMQWASGTEHGLFGAREMDFVNPVRASVWKRRSPTVDPQASRTPIVDPRAPRPPTTLRERRYRKQLSTLRERRYKRPMPERLKRLDRIYPRHPVYFVTTCTAKRRPLLANEAIHQAFSDFAKEGETDGASVGRYVLMPDHLHLFVAIDDERLSLSRWLKALKGSLSKSMRRAGHRPPHWQKGYFDHLLRSSESYSEKWNYVRENPIRAALITNADDWPYAGEVHALDVRDDHL